MRLHAMVTAAVFAAVAAIGSGGIGAAAESTVASPPRAVIATFEGERFDMSDGWGTAKERPEIGACHVAADGTATCYRTEHQLTTAVAARATGSGGGARSSTCSVSLRLYDGTSHGGAVLYINTRGVTLSLSPYGFNNRTSSYRVGACSAILYDGFGSGVYPGNTSAWVSVATMWPGWSNRISSVRLY